MLSVSGLVTLRITTMDQYAEPSLAELDAAAPDGRRADRSADCRQCAVGVIRLLRVLLASGVTLACKFAHGRRHLEVLRSVAQPLHYFRPNPARQIRESSAVQERNLA